MKTEIVANPAERELLLEALHTALVEVRGTLKTVNNRLDQLGLPKKGEILKELKLKELEEQYFSLHDSARVLQGLRDQVIAHLPTELGPFPCP